MDAFKIYQSDAGLIVDGNTYYFEHLESVTIEDPERVKLTRGANTFNKKGLVYREGAKEPKRILATLLGVSIELFNLMDEVHGEEKRIEFFFIDRKSGSSMIAKDAIISQKPRQLEIGETPESMNVNVEIETFNLQETRK